MKRLEISEWSFKWIWSDKYMILYFVSAFYHLIITIQKSQSLGFMEYLIYSQHCTMNFMHIAVFISYGNHIK